MPNNTPGKKMLEVTECRCTRGQGYRGPVAIHDGIKGPAV